MVTHHVPQDYAADDFALGAFLHGLLTVPDSFAVGGLRHTATATDTTTEFVEPGRCGGPENWWDWPEVPEGHADAVTAVPARAALPEVAECPAS
ncbi:hypothetical protein ACWGOK_36420 [Streptomyces eurythermus]